ncbi:hypothetical protein HRR86_008710 [Exophiala dermatitidis]|nr:hypothetical protein HRR86_008710 [Exophiala dermatitidis]
MSTAMVRQENKSIKGPGPENIKPALFPAATQAKAGSDPLKGKPTHALNHAASSDTAPFSSTNYLGHQILRPSWRVFPIPSRPYMVPKLDLVTLELDDRLDRPDRHT